MARPSSNTGTPTPVLSDLAGHSRSRAPSSLPRASPDSKASRPSRKDEDELAPRKTEKQASMMERYFKRPHPPASAVPKQKSLNFSPDTQLQTTPAASHHYGATREPGRLSSTIQIEISPKKPDALPTVTPKTRGRPKGWKPGMTYAEIRGDPPAKPRKRNTPGTTKRRGRPPRPNTTARDVFLNSKPKFPSFVCEWKLPGKDQCHAELHNLSTLKRHILRVHGEEEPLICFWGKCATSATPPDFEDDEDAFTKHIEKKHLRPYMWHMGDGCQNEAYLNSSKKQPNQLPAYLFKGDVQVTPSVMDQELEGEQASRQRKRKVAQLRAQMDENAPDEEEYMAQILGESAQA